MDRDQHKTLVMRASQLTMSLITMTVALSLGNDDEQETRVRRNVMLSYQYIFVII